MVIESTSNAPRRCRSIASSVIASAADAPLASSDSASLLVSNASEVARQNASGERKRWAIKIARPTAVIRAVSRIMPPAYTLAAHSGQAVKSGLIFLRFR